MIRFGVVAALAAALMISSPDSVIAQAAGSGDATGTRGTRQQLSRAEMVARAEQLFYDQMARELRLTDEQTESLRTIFAEYEQPRREIAGQKRRYLGEAHSPTVSEERALTLVREIARIREREVALLREEEEKLLEVLRPSQVLALQIYREQAGDRIRGATNFFQNPGTPGSGPMGGSNPFRSGPTR